MIAFVLAALAVTIVSVIAAARLAANRARSRRWWMLAAALLGPLPLIVLVTLPRRIAANA
jgi:hypothetical protein